MGLGFEYELVGSKNSYYSAKVRAFLQYKRLPYREISANLDSIRRVIDATGTHFYPVVFCPDGEALQDSCDIVEALEERHPERPVVPKDPALALVATVIETVADELMILSGAPFRWVPADTSAWAENMFVQVCRERLQDPAKRETATANGRRIASSIRRRVSGLLGGALDRATVATKSILDRLEAHFTETAFLLGDRPSLADLGMMNAIYGHLYRDPGAICDHIHWNCVSLSFWVEHMLTAAGESDAGDLFAAPTLDPILEGFAESYAPLARATIEAADRLLPAVPIDAEPDPVLGASSAGFLDGTCEVPIRTYWAWKLQRLIDAYEKVPEGSRAEADRLMEKAGFLDICRHRPAWRLSKERFVLRAEEPRAR